ncbi:GerMN domain-containing protein [Marispirochaeta sp.]|jgi:germination protein M|uniref:GerMN domain-containing protein n=1 Tax=Marispirochaeta sp. TaxID=2038653 RepID=UPI0029C96764|nr:GerMN domain-containing protein [Marispirochaeta sp.]
MKRKRKASLGCLFWIALILLILVIFLFNRRRIEHVLEATGFIDVLSTVQEKPQIESTEAEKPQAEEKPEQQSIPEPAQPETSEESDRREEDSFVALELVPQESSTQQQEPSPKTETQTKRLRRATLYFVFHDGTSGELRRVVRPIYYTDSPLTDTLKALLEGPSSSELNQNLLSLVPGEAKIKSVAVKDGIAYIDMTEAFRFNTFGYEGAVLQLKQLIYTATEFPTVDRVQFLIEGVKQQYLNPEGLYIGKPLGREDL